MFYLPDGSTGYLNSGSHLKFPAEFKGKSRKVELKGEAYFDVLSNPRKPFIVSGTSINVIAHGTSFNVMAFPEDKINQVTLVSGEVKIQGKRDGHIQNIGILKPDQMCIYDESSSFYRFVPVDANRIVAWKAGKLIFRDEPFEEVVKRLNRRYNTNMVIKDEKLKSYKYLATFEDETLDEVIKLIKISAPIEVRELAREKNQDGTFDKRTIEFYYKPKN
jgi:ferric-dicitrate binding protein FerR (iron transport regulator)